MIIIFKAEKTIQDLSFILNTFCKNKFSKIIVALKQTFKYTKTHQNLIS